MPMYVPIQQGTEPIAYPTNTIWEGCKLSNISIFLALKTEKKIITSKYRKLFFFFDRRKCQICASCVWIIDSRFSLDHKNGALGNHLLIGCASPSNFVRTNCLRQGGSAWQTSLIVTPWPQGKRFKTRLLHLHEIVERLNFDCSLFGVCLCVRLCLWTKFQPYGWTDLTQSSYLESILT